MNPLRYTVKIKNPFTGKSNVDVHRSHLSAGEQSNCGVINQLKIRFSRI